MKAIPKAYKGLVPYNQFLLCKLINRDGKLTKLPINPHTLQLFEKGSDWQNKPEMMTSAEVCFNIINMLNDDSYKLGFLISKNDPFYFLDIDHCLVDGQWSELANWLISMLPGAAVEVSSSGEGLHVIGQSTSVAHSCRNAEVGIELYTQSRVVCLTGYNVTGLVDVDNSAGLTNIISSYFNNNTQAVNPVIWSNTHDKTANPIEDDDKLIKKALLSKSASNAFGCKASFKDLWERNIKVLVGAYPASTPTADFNESDADAALAQHLAFWTGNNCERIKSLMLKSGLVRDKWYNHKTYLCDFTITRAVGLQKTFYVAPANRPHISVQAESIDVSEPVISTGFQFLGITQQIDFFKGCTYIQDIHKVFTPTGAKLKPEQFNATYGGYVFQIEDVTNGKTTKNAWEAFTQSQCIRYPYADSTCFKPSVPPRALVLTNNRRLLNTYVPINTPRTQGDPKLFLDHVKKLIPDPTDQEILLSYMAACVQHLGVKFQWSPLIQGTEGNGKTLFSRCVGFAIGEQYTHMPPAEQIAEKYNGWLFEKLFIGVEDIYIQDHKTEVIEILKPMITNTRIAIRDMGVSQIMRDICCNFIFNSNHKKAVKKTRNDRRFCIFYTAQQTYDDVIATGMVGDYFTNLYQWLRSGGYEIVSNYLHTYDIKDKYNPATGCQRAPVTTSTEDAIRESLGTVEYEIMEAISEGKPGFSGGWISSMAVEKLLDLKRLNRLVPVNKRHELMITLGYDYHPALKKGRVNNIISIDGGKPRLFIKKGHVSTNLTSVSQVSQAYQDAQKIQLISPFDEIANITKI